MNLILKIAKPYFREFSETLQTFFKKTNRKERPLLTWFSLTESRVEWNHETYVEQYKKR